MRRRQRPSDVRLPECNSPFEANNPLTIGPARYPLDQSSGERRLFVVVSSPTENGSDAAAPWLMRGE
jgi:hypothetical protein